MKIHNLLNFIILITIPQLNLAQLQDPDALYYRLDPLSIKQHLTYYKLYPDSENGQKALKEAWSLISSQSPIPSDVQAPSIDDLQNITGMVDLITQNSTRHFEDVSSQNVATIREVSSHLKNRKLKGFKATTEEEVKALPSEEIDLTRALLLNQFKGEKDALPKIEAYEAALDFMALQILPYAALDAAPEAKIQEINRFIFEVLEFRFPPHSLWAENIDTYTFLPSVLDSRKGVCLGVSILYLCLAQRLGLDLEIITPPGHIYVRYYDGKKCINIETTARGINLPNETYLGINTHALKQRSLKEVIGFARYNQASVYWQNGEHQKAIEAYEEAIQYLPNDALTYEFLGYNYILAGDKIKGLSLLKHSNKLMISDTVFREPIINEYLNGDTDIEGVSTIFSSVDHTRDSILKKQALLIKKTKEYPKFKTGFLHLAITYLQLGETKNALKTLNKYHQIDPNNPTVEYYLAILNLKRYQLKKAWTHYSNLEKILSKASHSPQTLKDIKDHLMIYSRPL